LTLSALFDRGETIAQPSVLYFGRYPDAEPAAMPASAFSSHRGTVGGNKSHIDYIATEVGEQELDVLRSSGLFRAGFMPQGGHRPAQASEAAASSPVDHLYRRDGRRDSIAGRRIYAGCGELIPGWLSEG